jgi:hypothetical protein
MEGLTAGRIVHYVLTDGRTEVNGHRPAIVVKVWNSDGTANLQVFTDGGNDYIPPEPVVWKTSVMYSEDPQPGTWHWIERA